MIFSAVERPLIKSFFFFTRCRVHDVFSWDSTYISSLIIQLTAFQSNHPPLTIICIPHAIPIPIMNIWIGATKVHYTRRNIQCSSSCRTPTLIRVPRDGCTPYVIRPSAFRGEQCAPSICIVVPSLIISISIEHLWIKLCEVQLAFQCELYIV